MRSVVIEEVLEAVDHVVEEIDGLGRVVSAVELVSLCAVASLDGPIELGSFGREFVESGSLGMAGLSNSALNSLSPSTWMPDNPRYNTTLSHVSEPRQGCKGQA